MLGMLLGKGRKVFLPSSTVVRSFSSSSDVIRNIGILAHIDAGKTTTTERMLYYSGEIRQMGEVHDGDTVMDFMTQERDRGITIGSAAITFNWRKHQLNLIDTPGHVDFTVEVERSVRVLDGAVTIFDGVAGVEAQTETVWQQADRYQVPRIGFVNKLDREGASLQHTLEQIEHKFDVKPLPVQLPIFDEKQEAFTGLLDLVKQEFIEFIDRDQVKRFPVVETPTGPMHDLFIKMKNARHSLIEALSDFDDEIAELFLMEETIGESELKAALRRVTINMDSKVVVVLCGSSLKNKGVQPLLDAVVDYLPSPADMSPVPAVANIKGEESNIMLNATDDERLCALAFKVKHDRQRGPVVFFRVYSGVLHAKSVLLNTTRNTKERITRLMKVAADDTDEVDSISAGNIGAAVGLKHTCTGDTIILGKDNRIIHLPGVKIPEPVFTCSIEAESSVKQKELDQALINIQREDPSFLVTVDEETGQTLMSGMGELHLEIIKDRIATEYKINPSVGPMRVAYRESISEPFEHCENYDTVLGTSRQFARVMLEIEPLPVDVQKSNNLGDLNEICWKTKPASPTDKKNSRQGATLVRKMPRNLMDAVEEGIKNALHGGPLSGFRLAGVKVTVDAQGCEWDSDSNANSFRICASKALKNAVLSAEPVILEPIMRLEASVPDHSLGDVLSDLSSQRRANIQDVGASATDKRFEKSNIEADVPLAEMVGYATGLRSRTKGEGTFSLEFSQYAPVDELTRATLVKV